MPCYHPLKGYFAREVNDTGKRSLVFNLDRSLVSTPVQVPCGRCIGCRLDRSLSWAIRCVHEAKMHSDNCFLTLTYDDEHLPKDGSLNKRDFPLFMKRLRQNISPQKVRFFQCGEYGDNYSRPHHHCCLFGFRPSDLELFSVRDNVNLYKSEMLSSLWGKGFVSVGDVTYESAAYIARYVLKKWSKDLKEFEENGLVAEGKKDLYEKMCALSNEEAKKKFYGGKLPEFVTMSRRPGIGDSFYKAFKSDLFPHGFAVLPTGKTAKVPQFYDLKYLVENPFVSAKLKCDRLKKAESCPDNTPARLDAREIVKKLTIKQLRRGYEYESACV